MTRSRPDEIEEPGPGQESVWDYPRPPRIDEVREEVRVELDGEVLARSNRALAVKETAGAPVYYFPPEDVRTELFGRSRQETFCEWKGIALYRDVRAGDLTVRNAVWSYPSPEPGYEPIAGWYAFHPRKMSACWVGGERARPQPGEFYGGWITSKVVGPFKGEPGTEDW